MNKSELVDAVASGAGVSRGDAEGVLTTFFETVRSSAKSGDTVSWPGFGKFKTSARAARTARNPQTGQSVKVKASTAMKFTPSSVLKDFLNTKGSGRKAPAKASAATTKAASGGRVTAAKVPAAKATPTKAAAKSTPTKTTATKASPARSTATKSTAANSTATKKAPAKKAPATRSTATKKAPAKRSR